MLKITAPFIAALMVLPFSLPDDEDPEHKAVRRAVQDYVEAFYEAKPELIERGVHPDLDKYGFWRSTPDVEYRGMAMTFDSAKELAANWNADGGQGELTYEIELLDVADQTAAAKLTAKWGIDYMTLARFDGKWKIRHVLWQSHPPEKKGLEKAPTKEAIRKKSIR